MRQDVLGVAWQPLRLIGTMWCLCPAIIPPPGLAESSCDELERRLGWPQPSGDSVDWKTLDWMTKVRTVTLSDRHDPD